jgi:hypothetical protein
MNRGKESFLQWMMVALFSLVIFAPALALAGISNPGFESGTSPWVFHTNGSGSFLNDAPGAGSARAGHIVLSTPGTNVRLHQAGVALEPNTRYTLSFKAYSNTGHNLSVSLQKYVSPYTNYGLSARFFNLTSSWSTYTVEFTTSGFAGAVNDGRLMFWFAPYDAAGDQYFIDDVVLEKAGGVVVPPPGSILSNPGFETGTTPWFFYTNGGGTFLNDSSGDGTPRAGHIMINTQGSNVQLYQSGVALEANTQYRLSFKAYSNTGHDVSASLQKHGSPYTSYGLLARVFNLTTAWQTFTADFTTTGFAGAVNDGRLLFWLAPYDVNGDQYFFDDVVLAKTGTAPPPPPPVTSAPVITAHPVNRSVSTGMTATFSVTATGTSPLSYQWQKNGVNIAGATNPSFTTPVTVLSDSGATFRCGVSNAYGSATSNAATLTVSQQSVNNQFLVIDRTYDHTTSYKAALLGETPSPTNSNCIFVPGITYSPGETGNDVCNHEAFKFFQMPSNTPSSWTSPVNYAQGTLYQRVEIIEKPTTTPVRYAICFFQDQVVAPRHACGDLTKMSFTGTGTFYSSQSMSTLYQYSTAVDWTRKPHVIMLHMTDANNHQPDSYPDFMDLWYGTPNWNLYYPMKLRYTAIIVPPGGGGPVWP